MAPSLLRGLLGSRFDGTVAHFLSGPAGACHNGRMRSFLVRLLINTIALWLTTLVLGTRVRVEPYGSEAYEVVLSYLLVALVFGLVNGVVGTFVRIVAFPLYILTLGLISLIVNGLLLLLVAWLTGLLGFGLVIEGFWWGVLGAFLLSIFGLVISAILRPLFGQRRR